MSKELENKNIKKTEENKKSSNSRSKENKPENKISSKGAEKKKKSKFKSALTAVFYVFMFLIITTPLVFLYGPYVNIRRAVISTVLATRHAYWITDNFSEKEINELLGNDSKTVKTQKNIQENEKQDYDKVNIKKTSNQKIESYRFTTDRYKAYILEIKDPAKVKVAMTRYLGKLGQKTSEMAEEHNAVAAINGGAFIDVSSDGTQYAGTGAFPGGFVISGGKVIYPEENVDKDKVEESVIAFTDKGKLIIGSHSIRELEKLNVKEAMCFRRPTLIMNGKRQIKNKMEEGLNPRTAIGQKADGTVIFVVVDGRKISTPGASLYDVQEIMMERGAVTATPLDGGYSSTLYYNGQVINSPNAWNGERSVATAFYVEP